jgi:hypothetical protein
MSKTDPRHYNADEWPKAQSWRHQLAKDMERLHPQSWRELRQLVKLHGGKALLRAIRQLEEQER